MGSGACCVWHIKLVLCIALHRIYRMDLNVTLVTFPCMCSAIFVFLGVYVSFPTNTSHVEAVIV